MMQIMSMAMLAGLMSRKYNITIQVSGDGAYTSVDHDTGKVSINIPAIEYDDDKYLGYIRGYIDHEVGHVKYTRHDKLYEALEGVGNSMQVLRKNIWNILEDTYVERMMMQDYAGCGRNLRNLVRLVFGEPVDNKFLHTIHNYIDAIINYILFNQRSRMYPFLSDKMVAYRSQLNTILPALADVIDPIMDEAWKENDSTEHNLQWADRITDAILATVPMPEEQGQSAAQIAEAVQNKLDDATEGSRELTDDEMREVAGKILQVLKRQDSKGDRTEPSNSDLKPYACAKNHNMNKDFHHAYRSASKGRACYKSNITMTQRDNNGYLNKLSQKEKQEALLVTAKLSAQLKALLQTYVMNRGGAFRRGRLDANRLARLAVNDQRVFQQRVQQRGLDTEIVILMDMTGSMQSDDKDVISSEALYAITHALNNIKGIRMAVYGFSSTYFIPIKEFDQPVHGNMHLECVGGTYAGEASMMALSKFSWREGTRRIFIVMTDGDTYNRDLFIVALNRARKAGVEVVGIGICDDSMRRCVYENEYVFVNDIKTFPAKLFAVLRGKLVRNLA